MKTRLQVQTKTTPTPSFTPVRSNLLPHRSTEQAEPPLVPPILHDMLPKFQAKLTVGQPNDKYEQEADRVADQVMRMPEPKIQRVCPKCEEELQRQPINENPKIQSAKVTHGSKWKQCKPQRPSPKSGNLRVSGFDGTTGGTYISHIRVDIKASTKSTVTLTWQNTHLSSEVALPISFDASPGAGKCTTDCSNPCNSQEGGEGGSYCTPLSPPDYTVQGYGCYLPRYRSATFVTWFHYDREIAFHYYDVPAHPASHGCVRLGKTSWGAEWIYDNTLAGITKVTVNRDVTEGPGPKCWKGNKLISRPKKAPKGAVGECAKKEAWRKKEEAQQRGIRDQEVLIRRDQEVLIRAN